MMLEIVTIAEEKLSILPEDIHAYGENAAKKCRFITWLVGTEAMQTDVAEPYKSLSDRINAAKFPKPKPALKKKR